MAYRNGNYSAFYVTEPFNDSNLAAHATKDFVYYNMLRMWKAKESSFPFIDSHAKNYNVRDGSDWERTLKPRIRERLRNSKNVVLFLSSITKNSRALREEIDYGINQEGLPIVVVYPDYGSLTDISVNMKIKKQISDLWNKLPIFRNSMQNVPTIHVPNSKLQIQGALGNRGFTVHGSLKAGIYVN